MKVSSLLSCGSGFGLTSSLICFIFNLRIPSDKGIVEHEQASPLYLYVIQLRDFVSCAL